MAMNKKEKADFDMISRQRNEAVRLLQEMLDNQTKTDVFYDELISIQSPPKSIRRYVQTHSITARSGMLTVDMVPAKRGVEVRFNSDKGFRETAIIPQAANSILIVTRGEA